ncbi:unnamed protein product, partial [Ectocarpus sp. 8 AP-2014]
PRQPSLHLFTTQIQHTSCDFVIHLPPSKLFHSATLAFFLQLSQSSSLSFHLLFRDVVFDSCVPPPMFSAACIHCFVVPPSSHMLPPFHPSTVLLTPDIYTCPCQLLFLLLRTLLRLSYVVP